MKFSSLDYCPNDSLKKSIIDISLVQIQSFDPCKTADDVTFRLKVDLKSGWFAWYGFVRIDMDHMYHMDHIPIIKIIEFCSR
jgi:hypothetical protein